MTYDPKNPLDDLRDLEDHHLRVIARQKGGNELAQAEAKEAQRILDARAQNRLDWRAHESNR